MKCITLLIAGCLLVSIARADTFDDAEAARRGVPVEKIQLEKAQARIAELEKQLAEAKAKADKEPAASPGSAAIAAKINTMPKNLIADGDRGNGLRDQQREKWWTDNVKFTGPLVFEGKLQSVSPAILRQTRQAPAVSAPRGGGRVGAGGRSATNPPLVEVGEKEGVTVVISCDTLSVLGAARTFIIHCDLENVKPEDALDWKSGMKISVSGVVDHASMSQFGMMDPSVEVSLSSAKKK